MKMRFMLLLVLCVGLVCGVVSGEDNSSVDLLGGLVSYWDMQDTKDKVSNNDMINYGANNIPAKRGRGYSFYGSEYMTIPSLSLNGSKSLSFWTYVRQPPGLFYILDTKGSDDSRFSITTTNIDKKEMRSQHHMGYVKTNIPFDGWIYIVVTYDSPTKCLKIYKDGILESETCGEDIDDLTENNLILGADYNNLNAYHGVIDELGLWDRELNPQEIYELWNNGEGKFYDDDTNQFSEISEDFNALEINISCLNDVGLNHGGIVGIITNETNLTVCLDDCSQSQFKYDYVKWNSPNSFKFNYAKNTNITLTTYFVEEFTDAFCSWSGDIESTFNQSIHITLDGNKSINANYFYWGFCYISSVIGKGSTEVEDLGWSTGYLRAIPDPGWRFLEWRGDINGTENPLYLEVIHTYDLTAVFVKEDGGFIIDSQFDDSADSEDLRNNAEGQDWYESRNDKKSLLVLDENDVGGNTGKKANLIGSKYGNAYLTQEFNDPLTSEFSVQWDIYVDSIINIPSYDLAGIMMIGDDTGSDSKGPNYGAPENFVWMAFFKSGGGTDGIMDLMARDGYGRRVSIAPGLNLKQWYTIKVIGDVETDRYDVYVDGELKAEGIKARRAKDSLTHLTFAQWNDGAGTFYVDNVVSPVEAGDEPTPEERYNLDITISGQGLVTINPEEASYEYGAIVELTTIPAAGWTFNHWSGDIGSANEVIHITMDDNKSVTAIFGSDGMRIVDSKFDASYDSNELRANGNGRDWYESRNDKKSLLVLDENDVGGNTGKKAKLIGSKYGNAYLTQDFSDPFTYEFSVQWDIYVDEIINIRGDDFAGIMMVGDDTGSDSKGPNYGSSENFVWMAFFKQGGGTSGTMELMAKDSSGRKVSVAKNLNLKQWYTIKVIGDVETDRYDVYVDGELKAEGIKARRAKDSLTHLTFAQWNDGAGTFYVDNVVSPVGPVEKVEPELSLTDGLISYYKSDTSGSYPDNHGSNDGTISGATFTSDGKINGAYSFNGIADYIGLGTLLKDMDGSARTVSLWFKWDGETGVANFIMGTKKVVGTINSYNILINSTEISHTEQTTGDSNGNKINFHFEGDTSSWHHLATMYNGSEQAIYLDGVKKAFASLSGNLSHNAEGNTILGSRPFNEHFFDGKIDEVAVWDRALTDHEIFEIYNNGGDEATLEEIYNLDVTISGQGSVTGDSEEASYEYGTIVELTAIASAGWNFSHWSGDINALDAVINITMDDDKSVTAVFSSDGRWIVDSQFDDSADSEDLRNNGEGQDWYESRNDKKSLLVLDENDVGGNTGKKANLIGSKYGNAYLTQEFSESLTSEFSVQWDIYVDSIINIRGDDFAGIMMVGDDKYKDSKGPNYGASENFVWMAFFKQGGGTDGTMDLVAKNRYGHKVTIASGLNLKQWYTINVISDVEADTYDVYVDGELKAEGITSRRAKDSLTHLTFAQWNDGAGTFYVDDVVSPVEQAQEPKSQEKYNLNIKIIGNGSAITDPKETSYENGTTIELDAIAADGWYFSHWSGDVNEVDEEIEITLYGDMTLFAVFGHEQTHVLGESVEIGMPGDMLEINEFIGDNRETITEDELEALKSGHISTPEVSTDYNQYLRLKYPDYGLVGSRISNRVIFTKDPEDDNVGDFLFFDKGEPIFIYELQFEGGLESAIGDNNELEDLAGVTLDIFGRPYAIFDSEVSDNQLTLELISKEVFDTLEEGESKTYTIEGVEYKVEVIVINDNDDTVKFRINGEITDALRDGDTDVIGGGLAIAAKDIIPDEAGDITADSVEFYLGTDKIVLIDTDYTTRGFSDSVKINDKIIDPLLVNIDAGVGTLFGIDSIKFMLQAEGVQGDIYIAPGHGLREYLEEPEGMIHDGLDIRYEGLTDSGKQDIIFNPIENKSYKLEFVTVDDKAYNISFVTKENGVFKMGTADNKLVIAEPTIVDGAYNGMMIAEDDYFILSSKTDFDNDKAVTHVIQFDKIRSTTDTKELTFTDISDGSSKTIKYTLDADSDDGENQTLGTATLSVGGKGYDMKVVNATDANGDYKIAVDLNNDGNINGDVVGITAKGGAMITFDKTDFDEHGEIAAGELDVIITTNKDKFDTVPADDEQIAFKLVSRDSQKVGLTNIDGDIILYQLEENYEMSEGMTAYGTKAVLYDPLGEDEAEKLTIEYPLAQRGAQVFVIVRS